MSNINYDTFNLPSNSAPITNKDHYPIVIAPDVLERFGSSHLDQDIFGISVSRLTNVQQLAFVRRVLIITIGQFFLVATMIMFIVKMCPLFEWLKDSTWTWWIPILPALLIAAVLVWQLWSHYFHLSDGVRKTLLSVYSILMSVVLSNAISKLIYDEGILVIIMSINGLLFLLVFTSQSKFPFSGAYPFVCSLCSICLSSPWLRLVYDMDPLEILLPITVSSFICIYIIFELFYIMENVTSDDYILANVYLFVDFVYPIRWIHHFCELTDMNTFPDILYPGDIRN